MLELIHKIIIKSLKWVIHKYSSKCYFFSKTFPNKYLKKNYFNRILFQKPVTFVLDSSKKQSIKNFFHWLQYKNQLFSVFLLKFCFQLMKMWGSFIWFAFSKSEMLDWKAVIQIIGNLYLEMNCFSQNLSNVNGLFSRIWIE